MNALDLEDVPDLDLGDDHYLKFTRWAPDDLPANREAFGFPLPKVEKYGAIVWHRKPDGSMCKGCITFDGVESRKFDKAPLWQVDCWDPLTLSPSLLCACGDHGFIRKGRWEKA